MPQKPRGVSQILALSEIAKGERFALEEICRSMVTPVYLGRDTVLCRLLGRYKFLVDTRDHGFGCNVLLDGYWEMWLTMIMARAIKPGMRVVDIGANYGYYALLMADLVGPEGRLTAVEPNPVARDLLERSLVLNGLDLRTRVVAAAAAASTEGTAELFVPDNEPKNASIVADPALIASGAGTVTTVPLWSLDEAAKDLGRIDFIKIDAEGAEDAILAGMRETLRSDRPSLVLEYNTVRYGEPGAILDLLLGLYGEAYVIDLDGTLSPVGRDTVLNSRNGHDWLLYFSLNPAGAMPLPKKKRRVLG